MASHANEKISKVLVANRGEIAVRVIRAAKDAGLESVAVYAEPDADAPHVRLADEAFALGGQTSAESYLDFAKLLDTAAKSGANAVHPGYGFLSENADFAQAVLDAGLIWIGPSPQSIRDLGDKVTARHIAARAEAPLVPGTPDPVKDADEVVAFAQQYGVPVAIKAAFGGGGRGMKVARTIEEIPELFESATREAVAAFGRGECFVERYLDKPRHVEAQVIADKHGNVVVAGTRDCSLQRRHPWIFDSAIAKGGGDSGETVRVESHEGQFLAWAAYSPSSRIRARVWSFDEAQRIDAPFFIAACARSIIARARFDVQSDGVRLVHGESDEVVPLSSTLDWARPQSLPVIVLPGVGHFFHGQLTLLKNQVVQAWHR